MVASGLGRRRGGAAAEIAPKGVYDSRQSGKVSGMSGETQLLLWIAGVHLIGLVCIAVLMIPALREPPDPPWNAEGGDDGWGNEPRRPQAPPRSPLGGLPLPDAQPARVRLRGHERLADTVPARERRPSREPQREPSRTPLPG